MAQIRVVVNGSSGRMGQEVVKAICLDPDTRLVGAIERDIPDGFLPLPDGSGKVSFSSNLENILTDCRPDVMVDFTVASVTVPAAMTALKHQVHLVIGTTGLTQDEINQIDNLAKELQVGVVLAPNFALGAVLMTYLSKLSSKYFDYAEIIEMHHHLKVDAPSGTSIKTAMAMTEGRSGKPFKQTPGQNDLESRGKQVNGIPIHSVRLPGILARQEVIFGTSGQTLSIRHDTTSRECYMPGILLAVKEVINRKGLVYGLDTLLGL
ncbi:MAG: 4-hydroxy-tetrahydrodipicolinate reductase [Dehalococcoidales bacterium]|nr:4-hydroxy-tetrahydrodipicolinate reductase [Dehalococcoidales bacterium]